MSEFKSPPSGSLPGTTTGPGSSTDNAITRWDGITGEQLQDSGATLNDSGEITAAGYTDSSLTADRAVISNGSKKLASSSVTSTELAYMSGVTSAVQTQLNTNATAISDHLSDATDAHDASAISSVASGNLAATDVQAALNELQTDIDTRALASDLSNHLSDATDAHDASAISSVASGNLAATDVQAALNELQTDIDTRAPSSSPTLTTPTIDDGLILNHETSVSTPSSGKATLFAKNDDKLYITNSSGVTTAVASAGTGEKNYITNPSGSSSTTGWANVGDLDIARTTTAGDLPREYTTATGLKITADSNTQSTADYVYFDFTLDDIDLNKKLKIEWSQKQTGSYVASDLAVIITTQADRTTALHTPITTNIPAVDGVFTTSFDSGSTATLSLVIRATTDMATDAGIVISDVVVGPGTIVQGAAVSEWQSFTPTFTNGTVGNGTATGRYRRVGNSIDVVFGWVWGSTSSASGVIKPVLPNSWTIDTTAQANNEYKSGQFWAYDQSAAKVYQGSVRVGGSYISAILNPDAAGTATSTAGEISNTLPVTWTTSDELYWTVYNLPISQWSGSGTVNLGPGAQVEYAYFTGTVAADSNSNGSEVAYGPTGATMSALSDTVNKYIVWQTPPQNGDLIFVQCSPDSGTSWSDTVYSWYNSGTTTTYTGARYLNTTNNVSRFQIGRYTGGSTAWASSDRIRFVKVKPSAPVGFGLAGTDGSSGLYKAGQAPGLTTGATISAGYVGEIKENTRSTNTPSITTNQYSSIDSGTVTYNDNNETGIALTAGVWLIQGVCFLIPQTSASVTYWEFGIGTAKGNSNAGLGLTNVTYFNNTLTTGPSYYSLSSPTVYVNISSTTTYYLKLYCTFSGGNVQARGHLKAVRIA